MRITQAYASASLCPVWFPWSPDCAHQNSPQSALVSPPSSKSQLLIVPNHRSCCQSHGVLGPKHYLFRVTEVSHHPEALTSVSNPTPTSQAHRLLPTQGPDHHMAAEPGEAVLLLKEPTPH